LRNHDELDIGRLPKDQQEAVFSAFGPEEEMQIYGRGIRRRLSPMLGGDCRRVKLANSLIMTLPGTPVIRYGDEIGMGEDLSLPERESVRTPMQWSDGPNGGFTSGDNPIRPPIDDGPYGFQILHVAQQRTEEDSLLNWMERIIRMRKEMPEIGEGEYRILDTPASILALRYEWAGQLSVFIHNFEDCRRELDLDVGPVPEPIARMTCVLTHQNTESQEDGSYPIILHPFGYLWLRAGGLEQLLA